ncbi:uncharacterized protein LOC125832591 [Solanum verrucosum]|uniref:uncharacterized protein LOC125832591 n=1 Tax=Solanum verrucosum TaxID=315347 RepID=UPI0020D1A8C6|nr:uncharacterized protein LOC125832591 [Solanum verrucosum]
MQLHFFFRFLFAFATTIPTISFHSSLIFLTLFPFPTSSYPFHSTKIAVMPEKEWIQSAIMDDSVVAELLLRLSHANPSPSPIPAKSKRAGSPLEWSVRRSRSKPVSVNAKKAAPRASPTTPLSWSGATSVSCGGGGGSGGAVDGGCEESSGSPHPLYKTPSSTRSKILLDSQVNGTSDATTSKRSRKKKTLAELKMDEILLIKERKQLKKEVALLRASVENQRDTNQKLKRMKLDVLPQQANERGTTVSYDGSSGQYQQEVLPSYPAIPILLEKVANKVAVSPSSLEKQQDFAALESKFVLPDLNIPFGEDSGSDILWG